MIPRCVLNVKLINGKKKRKMNKNKIEEEGFDDEEIDFDNQDIQQDKEDTKVKLS